MDFLKGVYIFGGILVFVFVLMFFVGDNFVGNVIWEPGVSGNCVDSDILILWDEVFVEGSGDVVILKDFVAPEGDCDKYIAYKNNSGELWVLYGDYYNSLLGSSGDLYASGKKILDSVGLYAVYGNVSLSFLENFIGLVNVSQMIGAIWDINDVDIGEWSILSSGDAENKFSELYGFVPVGDILFNSDASTFYFGENDSFDWSSSFINIVSRKDKALFSVGYGENNYDPGFFVEFSGEIGGLTFFENSSWNLAFDYGDYFNVSDNISVEFDSVGDDNDDGGRINRSFDGSFVRFMPVSGFRGWREFRLVARNDAGDIFSNSFIVNITRYNVAPLMNEPIPYIDVAAGGSSDIDLDLYFNDDDELSYGAINVRGIDVSFSGSVMKVLIGVNFSGYSKFRVYAFDGLVRTLSNEIYVFLEGEGVELIDELNTSTVVGNVSGSVENKSKGAGVVLKDVGWGFWVVLTVVVLVLIGGGFFIYYLIIKRKNNAVSKSIQSALELDNASNVDVYLDKLGVRK